MLLKSAEPPTAVLLNVENRTAAAVVALETCHSVASAVESKSAHRWTAIAGLIAAQLPELWSDTFEIYGEIAGLIAA